MNENVYSKLAKARLEFLNEGIAKSGRSTSYSYFELDDIVPLANKVLANNSLLFVCTWQDKETMKGTVFNCDNPNETIEFNVDFSNTSDIPLTRNGATIMNRIQWNGGKTTYGRRYLYMLALDIIENDPIDALPQEELNLFAPSVKKQEIKQEIKQEVKEENNLQEILLRKLQEYKAVYAEKALPLINKISQETNTFSNLTEEIVEAYIKQINEEMAIELPFL